MVMLRACFLPCIVALALAPVAAGQEREVLRKKLIGKVPPDLVAVDADWLAGPPTTLAGLRGKVVWLQFNF
jgi:hypothetical protein